MEQVSGLAWMTGFADSQPHNQRGPTDPNGGVHAAFGALVALAARERDGRGHLIESSFVEVALNSSCALDNRVLCFREAFYSETEIATTLLRRKASIRFRGTTTGLRFPLRTTSSGVGWSSRWIWTCPLTGAWKVVA